MSAPPASVAAVIAGGPGRRLGGAVKAALEVGGRSIAARQVAVLRGVFARVLVVASDPAPWQALGVETVRDREAGLGPLGGLQAALATPGEHAGVVCVAGDMPFLSTGVLELLRDRAPDADAVAARVAGRPEPLLARYARRCLPVVEAELAAGQRALHLLLGRLRVSWIEEPELRALDPELRGLVNVNTPEEYARAQELARREP
jgi:molybdopterin-guanine dinucleotide biosynthesis protein A